MRKTRAELVKGKNPDPSGYGFFRKLANDGRVSGSLLFLAAVALFLLLFPK